MEEWIHLDTVSGNAGETTVSVTVDANDGKEDRSGTVTVRTAGGVEKTLTVSQAAVPALRIKLDMKTVPLAYRTAPPGKCALVAGKSSSAAKTHEEMKESYTMYADCTWDSTGLYMENVTDEFTAGLDSIPDTLDFYVNGYCIASEVGKLKFVADVVKIVKAGTDGTVTLTDAGVPWFVYAESGNAFDLRYAYVWCESLDLVVKVASNLVYAGDGALIGGYVTGNKESMSKLQSYVAHDDAYSTLKICISENDVDTPSDPIGSNDLGSYEELLTYDTAAADRMMNIYALSDPEETRIPAIPTYWGKRIVFQWPVTYGTGELLKEGDSVCIKRVADMNNKSINPIVLGTVQYIDGLQVINISDSLTIAALNEITSSGKGLAMTISGDAAAVNLVMQNIASGVISPDVIKMTFISPDTVFSDDESVINMVNNTWDLDVTTNIGNPILKIFSPSENTCLTLYYEGDGLKVTMDSDSYTASGGHLGQVQKIYYVPKEFTLPMETFLPPQEIAKTGTAVTPSPSYEIAGVQLPASRTGSQTLGKVIIQVQKL